jgi:hypothetical protein
MNTTRSSAGFAVVSESSLVRQQEHITEIFSRDESHVLVILPMPLCTTIKATALFS